MSVANLITLLAPLVSPGLLILAEQNGPRPPKPYATLSVRNVRPAPPVKREVNDAGVIELVQVKYLTCELQTFGAGAMETAELAGLRMRFPTTAMRAEALGLGISRINNALDVPELLNQSQFEERAILEFTVYDALAAGDDVGVIESVEFECFDHVHTVSTPPEV